MNLISLFPYKSASGPSWVRPHRRQLWSLLRRLPRGLLWKLHRRLLWGILQWGLYRRLQRRARWLLLFKEEDEMNLIEFQRDNKLLYNKKVMDYEDPNKKEGIWDNFVLKTVMDKAACKKGFQSHRTMYGKMTHMESVQGAPHNANRQKWLQKNFWIINTHIMCHHSSMSAFKQGQFQGLPMLAHQKSQINPQSERPVYWSWF